VDWIGLARDRNRWRALVNSVLNLRVPWNNLTGLEDRHNTSRGFSQCSQILASKKVAYYSNYVPHLSPQHGASSGCVWRNGFQLCRLAASTLNKQPWTDNKGWSPAWGLGVELTTLHRKNKLVTKNLTAKDRNRWRALVNSVLNLRVPWNAGKLSSGLASSGLLSSAHLHRVS
jgi:hypothetical protein